LTKLGHDYHWVDPIKNCDFCVDPIKKHGRHGGFSASAILPFFIFSSEINQPMGTKWQEIVIR
jgi:hypothetical protein